MLAEHGHDASGDLDGDGWHGTMNYVGFSSPVWTWLRKEDEVVPSFGLPVPLALAPSAPPRTVELTLAFDTGEEPEAGGDVVEAPENTVVVRWSNAETLRDKDFAAYTVEEFEEARRLMADLRLAGALRRSRRPVPAPKGRPHLGRTLRTALRSGGEITSLRRVGRG